SYAACLGIERAGRVIRTYGSPFPRSNRLLLVHPFLTTTYAKRSAEMHGLIAGEITGIASGVRGNVAAFFPSYELLSEALERIRAQQLRKAILVAQSTWMNVQRDGALEDFSLA